MSEWETFCDESYYHLWRVRRENERGFYDGLHVHNGDEARELVELLNRLERERDEAREDLEFRRGLYKVQEEYLESERNTRNAIIAKGLELKKQLDEARAEWGKASMDAAQLLSEKTKVIAERDEARSIAQQLIHIASHCLGWHDNANPETIAEAIKRWNASGSMGVSGTRNFEYNSENDLYGCSNNLSNNGSYVPEFFSIDQGQPRAAKT